MFRKKEEKPIGAVGKLAAAERMRQATLEADERQYGVKTASQAIPVTIIFVLAVGLAMMLLDTSGGAAHAGALTPGQILFGAGIPKFTGDGDVDRLILLLIRGVAVFLTAGVAPFLAHVVSQAAGARRLNPLVACWGVLVALPLILYAFRDSLEPLFRDLMHGF